MLDPRDFRDVLTIAREGSLKGAANVLAIDASTMGRRLESIEARFGARLFLRSKQRLEATPDAASILEAAEKMEDARLAFERELLARRPERAGFVTITSAEWGIPILTPLLGELAQLYPAVPLCLRVDNRGLDLARREADIALRIGKPSEPALAGRRLGVVTYGLYGSVSYFRRHVRPPKTRADAERHAYCALDGPLSGTPHMRWQAELAGEAKVVLRTNSMLALLEAVRSGHGLATLPCLLAERHPELVRVLPGLDVVERDVWLVFHRDLRRSNRLRPLIEGLVTRVRPLFTAPKRLGSGRAPKA